MGNQYCFFRIDASEPLVDFSNFVDSSYVYFLLKGDTVVYIGQTKKIGARLGSHKACKDFDKCFGLKVPDHNLMETETSFIRVFRPVLNGTRIKKATPEDIATVTSYGFYVEDKKLVTIEPCEPGDYGAVIVVSDDEFAGKIGYYDNNNDENCDCENPDLDENEHCTDPCCSDTAIVYLGSIIDGYQEFDYDYLYRIKGSLRIETKIMERFFPGRILPHHVEAST